MPLMIVMMNMCMQSLPTYQTQGLNPESREEEPRPGPREPREEGPRTSNIFIDVARGRGRGRDIPVQRGNPFSGEGQDTKETSWVE